MKYFSRISAIFFETFRNIFQSFPKFFRDFPKKFLKFSKNFLRTYFQKFSFTFVLVSKLKKIYTTLIKINDSKNLEFKFLIFKSKTNLLQNFNETTHWNFPWYLFGLIPDTSAAPSELLLLATEQSVGSGTSALHPVAPYSNTKFLITQRYWQYLWLDCENFSFETFL